MEPLVNADEYGPLDHDDDRVLAALLVAQERFDPMPAGLVGRIDFALSLLLMQAELARLTDEAAVMTRTDAPASIDTITFTSTSTSLMVMLTESDHGVRIDGWVPGPGLRVSLESPDGVLVAFSDATGRLVWPRVSHGPVRFLVEGTEPGSRPVITPTIDV